LAQDTVEHWKAQELLEITYSCGPAVLARVSRLMACIRVQVKPPIGVAACSSLCGDHSGSCAMDSDHKEPTGSVVGSVDRESNTKGCGNPNPTDTDTNKCPVLRYLPLALSDYDLFALLPHLMCPGVMVTLRPAVIFACVAIVTHSEPLADRARAFLKQVRGKWLDMTMNENCAFGFVKLVLRVPEALTDEERVGLLYLRAIGAFQSNGRSTFAVSVSSLCPPHRDTESLCVWLFVALNCRDDVVLFTCVIATAGGHVVRV